MEVSPIYDPYVEECLLERTLVLDNRLFCEVGWPVPFLAAFISPVFPPGPIRYWVDSERVPNLWLEVNLVPGIFGAVGSALAAMLLAHVRNNKKLDYDSQSYNAGINRRGY